MGTPGRRLRPFLLGSAGLLVFVLTFEVVSRTSGLSESSLPRASTVLERLASLFVDATFLSALGQSLASAGLGLVVACLLAVPVGLVLGSSVRTFAATQALIDLMRPIPAVAIIPPALLILGSGLPSTLFLVVYSTFWVVLYNTIYAVRDVDPVTRDSARSFGFTRLQVLRKVTLPSAAPFVFAGIRIAATAALLMTIGIELIAGGSDGVGRWLTDAQDAVTRRPDVYAGAFFLGLVGLVVNGLFDVGSRRMFPWSVGERSQA